jgi:hypothetical protein
MRIVRKIFSYSEKHHVNLDDFTALGHEFSFVGHKNKFKAKIARFRKQ